MVDIVHEVWESPDEDGRPLHACCLAGPDGERLRRELGPKARLLHTFRAGSHVEAMTIYNRLLGRGEYTPSHPSDLEPYPEDWAARQAQR